MNERKSNLRFWIMVVVVIPIGCGGDDEEVAPVANFVSAQPPGDCMIANMTITVTFDNPSCDVTVSAGTVTVNDKKAIIVGPFTPDPLELTIMWANSTQVFNYTICSW